MVSLFVFYWEKNNKEDPPTNQMYNLNHMKTQISNLENGHQAEITEEAYKPCSIKI